MTARHAKFPPPPLLEAPPELEALVAAHAAATGREWGRSLLEIRAWFARTRPPKYAVFVCDGHVVSCWDGVPRIGPRFVPIPLEGGTGSN